MKIVYYRLSQTLNTKGLQRMNNLSIRLLKFLVFSWSTNTFDERATKIRTTTFGVRLNYGRHALECVKLDLLQNVFDGLQQFIPSHFRCRITKGSIIKMSGNYVHNCTMCANGWLVYVNKNIFIFLDTCTWAKETTLRE